MQTTLKDLMDRALAYADFPKDSLDADQEKQLIADINDGLAELWEAMAEFHGDLIHKTASITLAAADDDYALPADFYKAIKVFLVESSRRYKVEKFSLDEIDGFPKPLSSGSIELWYAPQLVRMKQKKAPVVTGIPSGWETYASLFAACRMLGSEGTDASQVIGERDRLMGRIKQLPVARDEEPEAIGDAYGRWAGEVSRESVTRHLRYRIMGSKVYFVEVEQGGV